MEKIIRTPEFLTATILNWKPLLKPDKYKILLVDSLQFLVNDNRIILYAYVIMLNHIHLIWQIKGDRKSQDVRRDFFKFTAGKLKHDLEKHHPEVLPIFKSSQQDRKYQFWERKSLCVDLVSSNIFEQKLNYIHNNPVKAGLCILPEDYIFSSAGFYLNNEIKSELLTHFKS